MNKSIKSNDEIEWWNRTLMTPKITSFMCEKNIFLFSKTKIKRCCYYKCWLKKAKENMNSSESDQQACTASTQITTNKDPSTGFPTQEESGN